MPTPFLSSEEYDERAHTLYNEGQYDEAMAVLREGLGRYPSAVELHVGMGYARMAREEYAWARRSFEDALTLDGEHEDALAGLGELQLKFGQVEQGLATFDRLVELGYDDDVELMLQVGRALFREGFVEQALPFFERAVAQDPESAEAVACIGYARHRLGHDGEARDALRRALVLDPELGEARVYLANLLYDAGELDASLAEFERTTPADHWDELGIWRLIELRKTVHQLGDDAPEFRPWEARLAELAGEPDAVDELLAEVEQRLAEQEAAEPEGDDGEATGVTPAHGQLEVLGSLLTGLAHPEPVERLEVAAEAPHRVVTSDGRVIDGSWVEIVQALRDARDAGRPLEEFMALEARRQLGATGAHIPTSGAEAFVRGSADAGLLRILR